MFTRYIGPGPGVDYWREFYFCAMQVIYFFEALCFSKKVQEPRSPPKYKLIP